MRGNAEVGVSTKQAPDNSGVGGISRVCPSGKVLTVKELTTSIGFEMERRCEKKGRGIEGLEVSTLGRSLAISRVESSLSEGSLDVTESSILMICGKSDWIQGTKSYNSRFYL